MTDKLQSPADLDIKLAQEFLADFGMRKMAGARNSLVNLMARVREDQKERIAAAFEAEPMDDELLSLPDLNRARLLAARFVRGLK